MSEEKTPLLTRISKELATLMDGHANREHVVLPFLHQLVAELPAADRIEALKREVKELRKERDAARQALEHDRSKVIEAVNQFSDAFARRSWLLDSRGSYEWDDDRYRDEFRGAYDELAAPLQQLKAIGKDWSNCPTNHDEIMRARTDWQTRAETAERQLAERDADLARMRAALEGACEQILDSYRTWVADDTKAHPRPGQIPRYDRARAALAGSGDGWRDTCATEGCGRRAFFWFERGGVGTRYCHACYMRIQALPAAPQQGGE